MVKNISERLQIPLDKIFWPIYFLGGFQSLAYSGIFILIVPLSLLIWPNEPFHALEMGILISTLSWGTSITGIYLGRLVDKYSRIVILFSISILRGISMIMLAFAEEGTGMKTWWYFFIFTLTFACFAGGSYPALVSLSNDIVPKHQRSQFFGKYFIITSIFVMLGYILAGFLFQIGFWRFFFMIIGIAIIVAGSISLIHIKEPKRGSQNEEIRSILQNSSLKYDFKLENNLNHKTILSRTNRVALFEGVFTNIFIGSLDILIMPYIQNPPYNFSPLSTGIFLVFFGLSGGLLGQLYFARLSDKIAEENFLRRIYFIIIALAGGIYTFILIFFIPLPHLTEEEGKNILNFLAYPAFWIMGLIYFCSAIIASLYAINQPPIIQDINLPETQGKITSYNQFLESIGYGIGPMIAAFLIISYGYNYKLISLIIGIFALPGIIFWIMALKWYPKDRATIKKILSERAELLSTQKGEGSNN